MFAEEPGTNVPLKGGNDDAGGGLSPLSLLVLGLVVVEVAVVVLVVVAVAAVGPAGDGVLCRSAPADEASAAA